MNLRKIVKIFIPKGLFSKIEPYGHLAEAIIFNLIYRFPARSMKVVGVTGTNGKTTTCFLIQSMLKEAGHKTGLMTTVSWGIDSELKPQRNHMTSATVPELMKQLSWMRSQGVEWLVLETSSQALAQNRVWGVPYSVAVLTNLTHEHLDWHKTFENYRNAKRKLFKITNKNRRGLRTGIINADDPNAKYFASDIKNPVLYGLTNGDLKASGIKLMPEDSTFAARMDGDEYRITCNLPGEFNVYNCLAAVGVGQTIGLSREQIEKGIAKLQKVSGRMERVEAGQDFVVLVDYAVTPDALEKVLAAGHELSKGKVSIVFGATGNRDKSKRPVMGEVAAKYADMIYLTDDETYTESPETIRAAVRAGIEKAGGKFVEIADREEAMVAAFKNARKDDVVILAGIGHQDSRNMGGKLVPWVEKDVAAKVLHRLYQK